jgi:L-alanine-DL-glutamate epimerase-like enolase superfamily enzyme
MSITLTARTESWPLDKPFTISRGTKIAADVVVVELSDDNGVRGWGECVPYPRYGETIDGVLHDIQSLAGKISGGMGREELRRVLNAGAARNALDCALWDLAAKQAGKRVYELAGLPEPKPAITAQTIGIGEPHEMAAAAKELAHAPLLKVKLNTEKVITRLASIRENAPAARLIIDPNESWTIDLLADVAGPLADLGVEMIEQPLAAELDDVLQDFDSPVPLCADESCHTVDRLGELQNRYQMVNIKLDKTGGLSEAIELAQGARALGFDIMIGCMVGTSLAMAPATLLSGYAKFVDLDGPLLLRADREPGLDFCAGRISPPPTALWG